MDSRNEIVVGVDGSPGSHAAVRWAARAASQLHAVLAIATVVDLDGGVWPQSSALRSELRRLARPLLEAARTVAAEAEPGLAVRSEALVGSPANVLATASANARLLVVSRTGRGRAEQVVLGSTPSRLAARTACPLVVAPPDGTWPPQRVVAAIGSLPADCAVLDWSRATATELGVALTPVHVARGPEDEVPDLPGCRVLHGDRVPAIADFCAPDDLLVLGEVRDGIPAAHEPRLRRILASARCTVAVVPRSARPGEKSHLITAGSGQVTYSAQR